MYLAILILCAVALTYLSLVEDEEEKDSPPKCSNCSNCKKDGNLDVFYPYCKKQNRYIIDQEKWAFDCIYYEAKGLNIQCKSFIAIMIIAIIFLGMF